jgi:hypothetical protein
MAVSGGMDVDYERPFFHQDGDDLFVEAEGLQRIARNNADFWRKGCSHSSGVALVASSMTRSGPLMTDKPELTPREPNRDVGLI